MNRVMPPESHLAGDELLAALPQRMSHSLRRGEVPDVERSAGEYPHLAAELRELWAAVLVAEQVASDVRSASRHDQTAPTIAPTEAGAASSWSPQRDYQL